METVTGGVTGRFFSEQTVECLCDAVVSFRAEEFDPAVIRVHASQFDEAHFQQSMAEFVSTKYAERLQATGNRQRDEG